MAFIPHTKADPYFDWVNSRCVLSKQMRCLERPSKENSFNSMAFLKTRGNLVRKKCTFLALSFQDNLDANKN